MIDFILRIFQRIGLWLGLLFILSSLSVGGMKFYQQSTYAPTQATVLALPIKCDMSYRMGKSTSTHRVVECPDVNNVKALYPDVDWTVNRVQYVDVGYTTPAGQPMRAVVPLGKLELLTAKVGEQIPVLQSRDDPKFITGLANAHFIRIWIFMLSIGIALFGASRWIKGIRNRRNASTALPRESNTATTTSFGPLSEPPAANAPVLQWSSKPPTVVTPSGFGRRLWSDNFSRSKRPA